jgi:hypothetical protein
MIPEELYKRRPRHNNTPESTLLIIANFIVIAVATSLFASKNHIGWFFWIIVGLLAVYNFFTIRKNREEFTKPAIIAYSLSLIVLIGVVILFIEKP